MNKIIKKNQTKQGYAVIELIFYIALFVLLSLVVINAMITMAKSFKETTLQAELEQSGAIMEKMVREIRASYDIGSITTNDLVLNTKDNNGVNKTVEFLLSGSDIAFKENNVLTGNLNTPNIVVTAINFTQITTTKGKAVKVFLTVRSSNDALARTQDFYDTVTLRGSY
ncbi:MAG: hypothetical protein WCP17_02110 [bacterium]